jgi:DNA-binding IclR family transcriptional regulator
MMRGVQRTVAVFECFSPQRLSLTLQEISHGIKLAKSTTFRVVQSLEEAGYLIRLEDQKYCLSFRFTRLGGMVMSTLSIRQVARPMMVELARRTNETVALNTVSGRDRICIDSIDTPSPLMSMTRAGQSIPLAYKGGTAKSLMAHLPQKELERLVAQLAKGNARRRAEIMAGLARVRKDGYCISHGERVLGLSAIAVPVWDGTETANHCITLTGPTVRMEPNINEFLKLLLSTAVDISRQLGAATVPTITGLAAPRARKAAARTR